MNHFSRKVGDAARPASAFEPDSGLQYADQAPINYRRYVRLGLFGGAVAILSAGAMTAWLHLNMDRPSPAKSLDLGPVCGFAVVQDGKGWISVIEQATGDAGMENPAVNQGEAITRLQQLAEANGQTGAETGDRYIMFIMGDRVTTSTIRQVDPNINSCQDFIAAQMRASQSPLTSPAAPLE